jgi:PAS domain-containing protein
LFISSTATGVSVSPISRCSIYWESRSKKSSGKTFRFELPAGFSRQTAKQIQQVYDMKEVLRDETPFQTRMGADGFYEYIFTPVFAAADSNTVDFVAGSTRDVSHRKQIELALRESQDRLHLTMESVTDYAILTMDTEGRFSSWNVGAERIFGYTEEEILGSTARLSSRRKTARRAHTKRR